MINSKVESGDLNIICIISPARVGSTFFMNVLAQSPSVDDVINQPFHLTYSYPYLPPDNREEIAYQRIWQRYQQARKLHSEKKITLVIKCMARNLGIGQQALRLLQLIDKIVILIRNPFLSIDSLLKMQVISIENMPEATQHDLDNYALQKNIVDKTGNGNHWQVLRDLILETRNYRLITDLLIETLAFIELNQYEVNIMNDYQCYCNRDNQDSFKNFLALSWTGWHNMAALYKQYISKAASYLVLDSTILRCMPEKVCREVSHTLAIKYTPHMVKNWKIVKNNIIDNSVMKTSWMKCCYEKATSISEFIPPKESPISINLFPYIYQHHILNTAYPSYLDLFKDNYAIRPHSHEEIQELLNIPVTKEQRTLKQVDHIFTETLLSSLC